MTSRARSFTATIPVLKGTASFKVSGKAACTGYLEFNPSTMLFGKKAIQCASLQETLELLGEVLLEVDYLVDRPEATQTALLSRLDIATDIPNVLDPQGVLRQLTRAGIPARRKLRGFFSNTHSLESVDCLTKSNGGYRAYNKSLQAKKAGSVVRFEVQARRGYLKTACPTLADLSESKMREIFVDIINPALEGLQETGRGQIDVILSSPKETAIVRELLGKEVLEAHGHFPRVAEHRLKTLHKPFLQRYGLNSAHDLLN